MRPLISSDDSEAEKKLKRELDELFFEEENELYELAKSYFLILEKGGIVCASYNPRYYHIDSEKIRVKEVENLIRKGAIGKSYRKMSREKEFLLFDNFDAQFNEAIKHPMGIETYYELKYVAKYPDEDIQFLLKEVLKIYDNLMKIPKKRCLRRKILATALLLACQGKYQYPIDTSKLFGFAGGPSAVEEAGKKIGIGLRYDAKTRFNAYIRKLDMDRNSLQNFSELWDKEKGNEGVVVTRSYIAGLAYLAEKLSGKPTRKRDIAEKFGVTTVSIRNHVKKILSRQKIQIPCATDKNL